MKLLMWPMYSFTRSSVNNVIWITNIREEHNKMYFNRVFGLMRIPPQFRPPPPTGQKGLTVKEQFDILS